MPPPPPAAVEDFAHDDDGVIFIKIADHHGGVGEMERVGVAFATQALGAQMGKPLAVLEADDRAAEDAPAGLRGVA